MALLLLLPPLLLLRHRELWSCWPKPTQPDVFFTLIVRVHISRGGGEEKVRQWGWTYVCANIFVCNLENFYPRVSVSIENLVDQGALVVELNLYFTPKLFRLHFEQDYFPKFRWKIISEILHFRCVTLNQPKIMPIILFLIQTFSTRVFCRSWG